MVVWDHKHIMELTCNALLKGATKVRFFHCTIICVCFVFLGFALTTALFLNERFPGIVSVVTGGKSSIEVTERGFEGGKLEGHDLGHQLGRVDHDLGFRDHEGFVAAPAVVAVAPRRNEAKLAPVAPPVVVRGEVGLASVGARIAGRREVSPARDVKVQSIPETAEESDAEGGERNEDEEGNGTQQLADAELVRHWHQLGQTDTSFNEKVLARAPTIAPRVAAREGVRLAPVGARTEVGIAASVGPGVAGRSEVSPAPNVKVQSAPEAAEESDAEGGEQNEDEEGNGTQQLVDAELVGHGHQLGRPDTSFKDKVSARAPTIAPRVAAREGVRLAPVGARTEVGIAAPVGTGVAGRSEVSPESPEVTEVQSAPEAAEESDAEGGEQNEDEEGNRDEEYRFQQAIHNGTMSVNTRVDYTRWDSRVGCKSFRKKQSRAIRSSLRPSLQDAKVDNCKALRMQHVSVLVKEWTWIPDTLNNLYSCECGLTCLWTNSDALEKKPDAHFYESYSPPDGRRRKGEPWRVYIDLEPGRKRAESQDLFVSYHAKDDLQVTYAGASFHPIRNYYISPLKHDNVLVYWSSSRCLRNRQRIATQLLGYLPHHSFGKCLNSVGGPNMELHMYPECTLGTGAGKSWSQSIHCAMSHYKFVLAIENTRTESYVTEKLFYALDAGSVPIYFGAPNVLHFVPPNSIIEGYKFSSMQKLAEYVKKVAADPVLYAEFHAWRRCGVMGPYGRARAVSLDSLPCRLCAALSKLGGRNA